MPVHSLNLKGLVAFADGTVEAAFDQHIHRAISDCLNRPGDEKARTVNVAVLVRPVMQQDGAVVDVAVECEVSSKVPKHVSRTVHCQLKASGRAVFNDLSPGDPRQGTLDEAFPADGDE